MKVQTVNTSRRKKSVTLQDVALEARLSIATVSRALHNPEVVDPSSQRKVHDAVRKLGYAVKQPLVASSSRRVALILPSTNNAFFSQMLEGVLTASFKAGYQVLVYSSHGDPAQEKECLYAVRQAQVDALLFCPLTDGSAKAVTELFSSDFPLVILYRRQFLSPGVPHIYYNNVQGGYLATKLLLKQGHRNIAFFIGFWGEPPQSKEAIISLLHDSRRGSYSSLDRLSGYVGALSEFGLDLDPSLITTTRYDFVSGYEKTKLFLSTLRDFDSVICGNDSVAAGVLQALNEQHIQVPEQVSVVGYDDSTLASITRPMLTSVHQDSERLGEEAVAMLGSIFVGERVEDRVLDTFLSIRNSTAMRQD